LPAAGFSFFSARRGRAFLSFTLTLIFAAFSFFTTFFPFIVSAAAFEGVFFLTAFGRVSFFFIAAIFFAGVIFPGLTFSTVFPTFSF